jgi:signal transduction histidine kinase
MSFSADASFPEPAEHGIRTVPLDPHRVRLAPPVTRPRQLDHDIQHQLATIAILASLLGTADDVGPDSRSRALQIVEETQWLGRLLRAASCQRDRLWSDASAQLDTPTRAARSSRLRPRAHAGRPVRLDHIATDVAAGAQLSTAATVRLDANETWAPVDPLTFWRVLTNIVNNAVRATGPHGEVRVQVFTIGSRALVQVEDDGPGFGAGPAGSSAHGLDIARDLVLSMAGELQIGRGAGGGCRVQLSLPELPVAFTER